MKVDLDLSVPFQDFYKLRDRLTTEGGKFTEDALRLISYDQLPLCCIGNAGSTACTQKQVQQEQERRRERFLNMETDEFQQSENYLKIERMYDDVVYAMAYRNAPKWDDLNDRQKVCAKLQCVVNHIDEPRQRLGEIVLLLRKCSVNSLPTDVAMSYMTKLKGLISVYPGRLSDETFRDKIADISDSLFEFLPDEERVFLDREELQGFSCSSDCFRVLI